MSKTMTTNPGQIAVGDLTRPEKEVHPLSKYWKALVPIVVGAALLLLPIPEGLKPNAWYYFALFVAVIIALILEPIPAAAVGLIGVTAATVSLLVVPKPADALKWALSGFQDGTVWLIFVAFMFALGYEKTGLGRRVALQSGEVVGKEDAWVRIRGGTGRSRPRAVYPFKHGAERWDNFPGDQKHPSAIRL